MESKEKNIFYNWSVQHVTSCSDTGTEENVGSCFIKRGKDEYIKEYGFETIAELKTRLGCMWSGEIYMEEIMKSVAVAAMKNQPMCVENKKKRESLDEFIYIF